MIRRHTTAMVLVVMLGACQSPAPAPVQAVLPKPVVASAEPSTYQAGVAEGALFTPAGLSPGGYGMRLGTLGEHNEKLGASLGRYGELLVKALALSTEGGALVLVKLPMIFPTDLLRRRVIEDLAAMSGLDFSDALVLNATHTHSGPARFWALPEGVGLLGMDEYDPAVLAALAQSIARVAWQAWENRADARIGAAELLRYDPENRINSDRRSHNDNLYTDLNDPNVLFDGTTYKSKDHRLWVLRVEDVNGTAIAAAVRMGMHGTILAHQMFGEDAPGGVERAVEAMWGVPFAMYLQGAAGDVSPRGDDMDRGESQQIEAIGRRVASVARPLWDSIETHSEGVIATAFRRLNFSRERLGYRPDEFGTGSGEFFTPYEHGAFYCSGLGPSVEPDDANPDTVVEDGALGCITPGDIEGVIGTEQADLPIGELSVGIVSALRIGEWTLLTLPGEPVSQMASQLHRQAAELGVDKVEVLGYSQTHLFYLTPSADWFQGGYEAQMNMWGWREGDFLMEQLLDVMLRLDDYGTDGWQSWDGDALKPLIREDERREQEIKPNARAPHWLAMGATSVTAFEPLEASFLGGDPWIDRATVSVECLGQTYTHSGEFGWRILQRTESEGTYNQILWEPAADAGLHGANCRFVARGTYLQGNDLYNYAVTSPDFRYAYDSGMDITATVSAGLAHIFPRWRPHPIVLNEALVDALPRYQETGFRLLSDAAGPDSGGEVSGGRIAARVVVNSGASQDLDAGYVESCKCYVTNVALAVHSIEFDSAQFYWDPDGR